jgi:predicted nucleotidyltransferase
MDRKAIKILKQFLNRLKRKLNAKEVILFGSWAKGKNLENSDFDLLIISEKFRGVNYYERAVMVYKLKNIKNNIEVICLIPEEFEENKNHLFFKEILRNSYKF